MVVKPATNKLDSKMTSHAMTKTIQVILALSVAAMFCWTFVWPFAVSADPANAVYHHGTVATLLIFFGCILALLVIRIRSRDEGRH